MRQRWIVTPYFFDEHDAALMNAVPDDMPFDLNNVGPLADRSPGTLQRTHRPIAGFVKEAVLSGDLPVSIAGDCGASLPVMSGLQQAGLNPVLVWLDAHPDFNTEENSPTGFLGGMPLAKMVGRGNLSLPKTTGHVPLAESDCWLVGARDYDPPEREGLDASDVHEISVTELKNLFFDRPVHLHIDNDVVDALDVPANNYPVPNGLPLEEVIEHCSEFATNNRICALSLSGWNGDLDDSGKTAKACRKLMSAVAIAAGRVSGRGGCSHQA